MADLAKACVALLSTLLLGCQPRPLPQCGIASLYVLLEHYGLHVEYEELRRNARLVANRVTFAELSRLCRTYGIEAEGVQFGVLQLRRSKPCGILELRNDHLVALVAVGDTLTITDPKFPGDLSNEDWSYARLEDAWTGKMLVIRKRSQEELRPNRRPFQGSPAR